VRLKRPGWKVIQQVRDFSDPLGAFLTFFYFLLFFLSSPLLFTFFIILSATPASRTDARVSRPSQSACSSMFFSSAPLCRAACPGISPSGIPLSSPRRGLEVQGRLNKSRWLSTPPGVAWSVSRGCPSRTLPSYVALLLLEYFSLRRDTPDPLVRSTCVGEVSFQPPNPVTHSFVALQLRLSPVLTRGSPAGRGFLRAWTSSMYRNATWWCDP